MVLPAPGIVGQQKPQRLPRQHRLVDGGDLVRQRLDQRGVDGEQRVEQVGQADPLRLGDQPEQRAVAVEAPRPALLHDLEAGSSSRYSSSFATLPAASCRSVRAPRNRTTGRSRP